MNNHWKKLKNQILGEGFDLSVVLTNDKLITELNTKYRKKAKTTNVLSFPLSENSGEIFVNTSLAEKEAKEVGEEKKRYLDFLFVHSLLHLKGYDHGEEMEEEEDRIMQNI